MKTLIAITLFAGMLLGLTGAPASSAYTSHPRTTPSAATAASPATGITAADGPGAIAPAGTPAADAATITAVEQSRADEILSDLKRQYRGLDDVKVRMGATPNSEQAVAYYTLSEIVVSPAHTATLKEILAHEIWHVIDYRDNGRLDWGENLPPANPARYSKS